MSVEKLTFIICLWYVCGFILWLSKRKRHTFSEEIHKQSNAFNVHWKKWWHGTFWEKKIQKYHCCRSTKTKKDKSGISKAWQGIERQRGRRENEGTSNRTDNNRNSDSLPLTSLANTNTLTSLCKQFIQALAIMQFMTIDYHNSFFHDQSVISLVFYGQCNGLCICWVLCFFWSPILILIEENVFE